MYVIILLVNRLQIELAMALSVDLYCDIPLYGAVSLGCVPGVYMAGVYGEKANDFKALEDHINKKGGIKGASTGVSLILRVLDVRKFGLWYAKI